MFEQIAERRKRLHLINYSLPVRPESHYIEYRTYKEDGVKLAGMSVDGSAWFRLPIEVLRNIVAEADRAGQ